MIPPFKVALAGFNHVAQACRCRRAELTAGELRAALEDAARLAPDAHDEPASLFYALARMPGPLDETWPAYPRLMGRNHARNLGLELDASGDELDELAWTVCLDGLSFEQVRQWFRERMRPL